MTQSVRAASPGSGSWRSLKRMRSLWGEGEGWGLVWVWVWLGVCGCVGVGAWVRAMPYS